MFVYSKFRRDAEAWLRAQNLDPACCRTYGNYSMWDGHRYRPGDRVVVLGEISPRAEHVVNRLLVRCPEPRPELERVSDAGTTAGRRE